MFSAPTKEPVKRLPECDLRMIDELNRGRRNANLSALVVKVRRCMGCRTLFESTGNRQCGCNGKASASLCGREMI